MKKIGILLLLISVISACKKEDITPSMSLGTDPVFSVIGTIDGQAISFQGGVDGAYLSTYSSIIQGVERFSGRLNKGENYVDFGVFNGNLFLPGSNLSQAGNQLKLTLENTNTLLHIEKSSFSNYQFIEGIQISVNGEEHGSSLTINEPGIYSICVTLKFNDSNHSETTICNEVILGYKDLTPFVISNIVGDNGYIIANINSSGTSVTAVEWFVDNQLVANTLNFAGNVTLGMHKLTAKVTFANGIVKTRTIGVNAGVEKFYLEDINAFKSNISNDYFQDFKAQFSVKLNGVEYQHIASTSTTQVVVNGFSYYGKNAANNDVYKVSGTVSTQMKNLSTNLLTNAQFNVVFGLEIP